MATTIKREPDQSLAIRIMHWIHALCIVLLAWSGMYIHYPGAFSFPGAMNGARYIHFIAMYVVTMNLIIKIYHALVTGYYKQIWFYMRHTKDLVPLAKYYLWMSDVEPKEGHLNPGQRATYSMWLFLIIIEALTGFALYQLPGFGWVTRICGGTLYWVRVVHFLGNWLFIITTGIHIYLSLYHGLGLLRGMLTGYEEPLKSGD
mgnify:FL=1